MKKPNKKAALGGITVLDLSRLLPGPFTTLMLQKMGARVIKIEDPAQGDYIRNIPPLLDDGQSALYHALNAGKENIVLDLKDKKNIAVIKKLIQKADVLVESFRPGVLKNRGLSPETCLKLNKKLIIASITGYGQKGVLSGFAGHDLNYQSLSGTLSGKTIPHVQWADLTGGGYYPVMAILQALLARQKTKRGCHLDLSMTHALSFLNMGNMLMDQLGGMTPVFNGQVARYKIYDTQDNKHIVLAALETKFWNVFCDLIQKPDWKDGEGQMYQDANPAIHAQVSELFKTKTLKEWITLLGTHDICVTPVLSPQEAILTSPLFKKQSGLALPPFTITEGFKIQKLKKASKRGSHTKKITGKLEKKR